MKKIKKRLESRISFQWPVRESNPGLRRERASSWPLDQQAGIEATRFELATSASRTQRSTKLSHASIWFSSLLKRCSSATPIYYHALQKNASVFLKKFQFFEKKFFRRIFRDQEKPHKALFYKEKQQSMGMGIMRCEQEEKCPESSQKPKKSKRNMKIQFKDR